MTPTTGLAHTATALDYLDRLRAADVLPAARPGRVGIGVVVANGQGDPLTALCGPGLVAAAPQSARVRMLAPMLRDAAQREAARGALLVIVRTGAGEPLGGDHGWRDAFAGTAAVAGLVDLGSYVSTPTLLCPLESDLWVG